MNFHLTNDTQGTELFRKKGLNVLLPLSVTIPFVLVSWNALERILDLRSYFVRTWG